MTLHLARADGTTDGGRGEPRPPAPRARRRRPRRRARSCACATSPSARSACGRSSRRGGASSRPSTRRPPAWRSSASTTRGSSTPTARSPRCCNARSTTSSGAASARSPIPTTCAPPPPTAPDSSSASSTPTSSTSATCARDGEYIWARTRVAVTEDEGVALAITHIEDVTEQLRTADQLRWAATHDELTGLPNRTELLARVDALLEGAPVGAVALLFIDLDNFKTVNDSLGHGIGDHLLSAMSRRLARVVGPDALLGRFGGDEFIVVLRRPTTRQPLDPEVVAEALLRSGARAGRRRGHRAVRHGEHRVLGELATGNVGGRAAPGRRRRDVPGQGTRARLRRGVRPGSPRDHGARPADRHRAAPRHRPRRDRAVLPADRRADDGPRRRVRGAGPLAAPRARAARAGRRSCRSPRRPGSSARSASRSCATRSPSSPAGGPRSCRSPSATSR